MSPKTYVLNPWLTMPLTPTVFRDKSFTELMVEHGSEGKGPNPIQLVSSLEKYEKKN